MDRSFSSWNTHALGAFASRIQKLQVALKSGHRKLENFAKPKSLVRTPTWLPSIEKFRTAGLALFAIAVGTLAYNTCCEESALAWLKSHYPSQKIWELSLNSEGYRSVQNPKTLAQTLKRLPTRVESGNEIWQGKTSENISWWVIYPGDRKGDPLIFCRSCDQIPVKWQPAGDGWPALETTIAQIRSEAPKGTFITKATAHIEHFDPREIRY